MLDTVTATFDAAALPVVPLIERDEFGAITGRPGLFTASVVPVALAECDNLGRPLCVWAPDGDLL
jgi:hypothetical protein